jgi:hypothetical protein
MSSYLKDFKFCYLYNDTNFRVGLKTGYGESFFKNTNNANQMRFMPSEVDSAALVNRIKKLFILSIILIAIYLK